jgi:small-conductance mechanosensitive channel
LRRKNALIEQYEVQVQDLTHRLTDAKIQVNVRGMHIDTIVQEKNQLHADLLNAMDFIQQLQGDLAAADQMVQHMFQQLNPPPPPPEENADDQDVSGMDYEDLPSPVAPQADPRDLGSDAEGSVNQPNP